MHFAYLKTNICKCSDGKCGQIYKMNGWSQAGLFVFFKTEVLNLCGGSSNCSTHRGFMLPVNEKKRSNNHSFINREVSIYIHDEPCIGQTRVNGID